MDNYEADPDRHTGKKKDIAYGHKETGQLISLKINWQQTSASLWWIPPSHREHH